MNHFVIKKTCLLVFTFFLVSKNYSQTLSDLYDSKEWFYGTKNKKGQVFFIKSEYISKTGNQIKIWTRSIDHMLKINGKTYENVVVDALYEFNCDTKQTKTYMGIIKDSEGNILKTFNPENPKWEDVVLDSVGEGLLIATCEHFKK